MRLQPPLPVLYITPRTDISSVRVHVLLKYKPLNAVRECGITFFSNIHCLYRTCNMQLTSYDGIFPSRQILIFVELIYIVSAACLPSLFRTNGKRYRRATKATRYALAHAIDPAVCYLNFKFSGQLIVLCCEHSQWLFKKSSL
jgi:hypothetical protein